MPNLTRDEFIVVARSAHAAPERGQTTAAIPVAIRLLSDQLTPVLAYRRLVATDERTAPSFLLESVEGGERQGRYSILGARPVLELVAFGHQVTLTDLSKESPRRTVTDNCPDPLAELQSLTAKYRLVKRGAGGSTGQLPSCVLGGWFGFAGYDTVRYAEPEKLSFATAPPDDRGLPDLHFGLYDGVVVFDHVDKVVFIVQLAMVNAGEDAGDAYDGAVEKLHARLGQVERHSKPLSSGLLSRPGRNCAPSASNLSRAQHSAMVDKAQAYIRAGDIFQVVVGQRFERRSTADPFDVYRALRAVNPSPYMVYLQAPGCILVASSPEILCRVRPDAAGRWIVTNRPLAGTRPRGGTPGEDERLEAELLADHKERAEHIMLVDLGRNDVGQVARPGSIQLPGVMEVERYSHVMHISSTVTGELREGLTAWDALRATLPVGTISGAPKIRAMQIIDELEPVRRGPYGGGMGYVGLDGHMDIALTLRTMVVPTALGTGGQWTYHLQAAGGIVADSRAAPEYEETVNKAAALARAVEVAEEAFGGSGRTPTETGVRG